MAFTLGQTINLKSVVTAGLPGIVLGLTVVTVTGSCASLADRLLGGSGIAGAAASSTAGNSAAVPQAVALADPSFAPVARSRHGAGRGVGDCYGDPDAAPHRVVVAASRPFASQRHRSRTDLSRRGGRRDSR